MNSRTQHLDGILMESLRRFQKLDYLPFELVDLDSFNVKKFWEINLREVSTYSHFGLPLKIKEKKTSKVKNYPLYFSVIGLGEADFYGNLNTLDNYDFSDTRDNLFIFPLLNLRKEGDSRFLNCDLTLRFSFPGVDGFEKVDDILKDKKLIRINKIDEGLYNPNDAVQVFGVLPFNTKK